MDQKKALQELVTVQRVCNTAKSDLDGVCRKVQTAIMQLKSGASSAAYNESESAYWDVYTLKESLQEAEYMLQRTMDILNNNRYFGGGGMVDDGAAVFMVEGMLDRSTIERIERAGGRVEMAGPGYRIDVRANAGAVERILQESGRRYNKSTQSSMNPRNPRYADGGRLKSKYPVDPGFRYVWIWVSDEEGGMKLLEVRRALGVFRIDEGYDDAKGKYFVKFDSLDDAEMVAEELDEMGIDYNLVDNISSAPTLPYKAYGMGGAIDDAGADYEQQELPLND